MDTSKAHAPLALESRYLGVKGHIAETVVSGIESERVTESEPLRRPESRVLQRPDTDQLSVWSSLSPDHNLRSILLSHHWIDHLLDQWIMTLCSMWTVGSQ